jgi:hypothetical protein
MFYRIECGSSGIYFTFPTGEEVTPQTETIAKNFTEWTGCSQFCDHTLRAPKSNQVSHKDLFWFTEKGFDKYGRDIIKKIKEGDHSGFPYKIRVIRIKENQIDVNYRDKYQVSGLIKRK